MRETFRFIEKDSVGSNDLIYAAMTYLLSHFQEELTLGKWHQLWELISLPYQKFFRYFSYKFQPILK